MKIIRKSYDYLMRTGCKLKLNPGACPRTGTCACRLLFLNRSRPEEEAIYNIGDDEKRRYV